MSNPVYPYPWEEWRTALDHFQKAMHDPKLRALGSSALSYQYFSKAYQNPEEARCKRLRFEKAMRWLDANMDEFDSGRAAVVGKEIALIGSSVQRTLHYLFAEIHDSLLMEDPPLEHVKAQVAEFEAAGL